MITCRWSGAPLTSCATLLAVTAAGLALTGCGTSAPAERRPSQARPTRSATFVRVPLRIIPQAVSFATARLGWVWGPRSSAQIPWGPGSRTHVPGVLIATTDGGRSWRPIHAPHVRWDGTGLGVGVSGVKFVGPGRGYLFGTTLSTTTDAGRRWRSIPVKGNVLDLETTRGATLALVLDCRNSEHCYRAHVERVTPDGLRPSGLAAAVDVQSTFVTAGRSAYVLTTGGRGIGRWPVALLASHDAGAHWRRLAVPCYWGGADSAALAAGVRSLALACGSEPGTGSQAKTFYASTDGGRHWKRTGRLRWGPGYVSGLAIAGRTWLFAEARLLQLELSTNSGHTWRAVGPVNQDLSDGWGVVTFLGHRHAVALPYGVNVDAIALSATDGRSWIQQVFR